MSEESRRPVAEQHGSRSEGDRPWEGIWALSRGAGRWLWRSLASVRLALVLILVLANLGLIGTLLIQVSPETAADPTEYAWWLDNVVRPKLGFWTTPLAFLGLFDVFHSLWFLGTGVLLVTSIVVCSLNRWKQIRRAILGTRVRLGGPSLPRRTRTTSVTRRREVKSETAAIP